MTRPGFGLVALTLAACSAADYPEEATPKVGGVPPRVASAHRDVMAARFSLVACQASRERQALNALDRRRGELELAIGRRFGTDRLAALQADSNRASLAAEIEDCAGAEGVDRLQQSIDLFENSVRRAGAGVAAPVPASENG